VVREDLSQIKGSRTAQLLPGGASALFAQEKQRCSPSAPTRWRPSRSRTEIEQGLLAPSRPREREGLDGIYTSTFMLGVNRRARTRGGHGLCRVPDAPGDRLQYANGTGQLLTLKDVTYEDRGASGAAPVAGQGGPLPARFTITKDPINQVSSPPSRTFSPAYSGGSRPEATDVVDREMERWRTA